MYVKRPHNLAWIAALALLLAACVRPAPGGRVTSPAPAAPATETPAPAAIESPPPASPSSPTLPPTRPAPTATLPPTRVLATAVPAAPTPDPAIDFILNSVSPVIYDSYPSPDNQWQARVVKYRCSEMEPGVEVALEQLRLIDGAGQVVVADSQLIYCGGLGAFGLAGRFWSDDSRFFFYTDAREGVPDGCGFWEQPLLRVEAASATRVNLGAGPFSPDGRRLAAWQAGQLVIWDVAGGELSRLQPEVDGAQPGPIAWSPDGETLAYLQVENFCPLSGASFLTVVSLDAFGQRLLVSANAPTFGDLAWDVPESIHLYDTNGNIWQVDVATGALIGTR